MLSDVFDPFNWIVPVPFRSNEVSAFNFGSGFSAAEIALNGGYFEVFATPVPEPSTYAAGALTLAALVISQRRRLRRFVFKA